MTEIKPCEQCGQGANVRERDWGCWVACESLGKCKLYQRAHRARRTDFCKTALFKTADEAIEAWNRGETE